MWSCGARNGVYKEGELVGYAARAVGGARLPRGGAPSAPVAIVFNGTVRARTTW